MKSSDIAPCSNDSAAAASASASTTTFDGTSKGQIRIWPRFRTNNRVLVIGIGGGLDILAAFGVAQALKQLDMPPGMVMFGGAELNTDLTGWVSSKGCLFKRPKGLRCTPTQRKRVEMQLPTGPSSIDTDHHNLAPTPYILQTTCNQLPPHLMWQALTVPRWSSSCRGWGTSGMRRSLPMSMSKPSCQLSRRYGVLFASLFYIFQQIFFLHTYIRVIKSLKMNISIRADVNKKGFSVNTYLFARL